ncbi:hypothetical protein N7520_008427 [Penicillium odoratum]|nr:uncharacterized protein N7520_008427 [Penicillium odoratum]KAJ5761271.1 hypothetical protein N7520_008427 [Penicillium odoratum]
MPSNASSPAPKKSKNPTDSDASDRLLKKPKTTGQTETASKPRILPPIAYSDATMNEPVALSWTKHKAPTEKPGLVFEECYDHSTIQDWQKGEQFAIMCKGAAHAQAEPAAVPFDGTTHDPSFFKYTKPPNPIGKTGKPVNVPPSVFRAWAQTLPLYTHCNVKVVNHEIHLLNEIPKMVKLSDELVYVVYKTYSQTTRAKMFPADFDATGDIRADRMPEDPAPSWAAHGVHFILEFKGYSLLCGREIAKRIGWKLNTKTNATTRGQPIDWSFGNWVIGDGFHITTPINRQAYRPDGSMVDSYIGTEKSAHRDTMT